MDDLNSELRRIKMEREKTASRLNEINPRRSRKGGKIGDFQREIVISILDPGIMKTKKRESRNCFYFL